MTSGSAVALRSGGTPPALLAAIATGVTLGLLVLVAGGASAKGMLFVVAVSGVSALFLVMKSVRRVFEALLIISVSMNLDFFIGFSDKFAETRPGVPLTLTGLLLLALFALDLMATDRTTERRTDWSTIIPFGLLVLWAALSIFTASRPDYVLQALPGYVTAFLLCLYARRLTGSADAIRFTVFWLAIIVAASGALGMLQYVSGGAANIGLLGGSETQVVQGYQTEELSRVSGLLRHPNTFAVFLNGLLPLLAVLGFSLRERGLRILSYGAFGLGLVALILTYSRGGWLSFGVSMALLVVAVPKKHWRPGYGTALLALTLTAVVVILFAATPLYSRIATRISEDDDGAAGSRIPLARTSATLIAEHPLLGVGLNNYQFNSPLVTDDRGVPLIMPGDGLPMRVHNIFLLTAAELGLPGALLMSVTIGLFFARGIAVVRRGAVLEARLALGLTCGLVAIVMHCLLEPATLSDPSYLILSFVGGSVSGLTTRPGAA